MKRFKLKKGDTAVYPVASKEAFEQLTGRERPYVVKDKAGNQKAFGLCPACENPVQLIGLYKRIRNDAVQPYAKHCNRDAEIAKHNETTSMLPYISCSK